MPLRLWFCRKLVVSSNSIMLLTLLVFNILLSVSTGFVVDRRDVNRLPQPPGSSANHGGPQPYQPPKLPTAKTTTTVAPPETTEGTSNETSIDVTTESIEETTLVETMAPTTEETTEAVTEVATEGLNITEEVNVTAEPENVTEVQVTTMEPTTPKVVCRPVLVPGSGPVENPDGSQHGVAPNVLCYIEKPVFPTAAPVDVNGTDVNGGNETFGNGTDNTGSAGNGTAGGINGTDTYGNETTSAGSSGNGTSVNETSGSGTSGSGTSGSGSSGTGTSGSGTSGNGTSSTGTSGTGTSGTGTAGNGTSGTGTSGTGTSGNGTSGTGTVGGVLEPDLNKTSNYSASGDCMDDPDIDCHLYNYTRICDPNGLYRPWTSVHCRATCGICIANTTPSSEPCEDAISNCDEYQSDMCTNHYFLLFREKNCKKFCGICTR